jgi:hypothetical protein
LIENAGNYAFYPFEPWYDAGYRCTAFRPPVGPTHSTINAEGVHSAPGYPHSGGIRFPTVRDRTACVADALYRVMLPVSSRYDV